MLSRSTFQTPIGTLQLISREHILLASGFGSFDSLRSSLDSDERELEIKKVNRITIITDLLEDYFDEIGRAHV